VKRSRFMGPVGRSAFGKLPTGQVGQRRLQVPTTSMTYR